MNWLKSLGRERVQVKDPYEVTEPVTEPDPVLTAALAEEAQDFLLDDLPLPELVGGALPPGVVEVLGGTTVPRKGSWHRPCFICGQPFSGDDVIRPVLATDGSRPYVHDSHLISVAGKDPESCRHGITPFTSCTWCSGHEKPVYPRSRSIRSRREGECIVCQVKFPVKSLIQKVSCATGTGWAHAWHVGRGK